MNKRSKSFVLWAVLIILGIPLLWWGRYALLGFQQEGRPDADWPARKFLERNGFHYVDQMGSEFVYENAQGQKIYFHSRMFTRSMMSFRRSP